MNTPTTSMKQLVLDGRVEEVEEQWMAAVERGERDLDSFRETAVQLIRSGRSDAAGPLLGVLLESMSGDEPSDELVEFALQAVQLSIEERSVRLHAVRIHEAAGRAELARLLAPLATSDGESARERVRKCLALRPGTFVSGTERVGPERVERFEAETGEFVLTDGHSERRLTPEEAARELTRLSSDHFRSLLRFDVDRLKELAEADPAGLVESALRSENGRLEWQNLKKLMIRGVVPQTAFSRWWNKAKGLVERNPMIQVYGDRQPTLILRTAPISHEAEMKGSIDKTSDPLEQINVILEYMDGIEKGHEPKQEFLRECADLLADVANAESTPSGVALLAADVHGELRQRLADPPEKAIDREALVNRESGFNDIVTSLRSEDRIRRALTFLKNASDGAWPSAYASALPLAPGRVADMIAKELTAVGHDELLAQSIQSILASPHRCGDGVFWLWKSICSGSIDATSDSANPVTVTVAMLRLMDRWARSARSQVSVEQRSLLSKMRTAVGANGHRLMNNVLALVDDQTAVALFHAVKTNEGITEQTRHHLISGLRATHHDAIFGKKEMWEEDVIFVTPRGLKRRQKEFEQIVNVDMVRNSEAIGHAADFGDLSENAEFTAALEQRDFLSRRANEIGDEIKKARVIPIDTIDAGRVNVGTRVRVIDPATGVEEAYTFLGPWDVDLDAGTYSYLAPFSQTFLGREVGDEVESQGELGPRKLKILSIEKAEIPD